MSKSRNTKTRKYKNTTSAFSQHASKLIPFVSDKKIESLGVGQKVVSMLPDVHVLKFGGQSIMDRGKAAVHPLVKEIVKLKKSHKMIIGTGGGTRSRHAYSVAMDLGMPTGVMAKLGTSVSKQNARMLYMLLSAHGGIFAENIEMLPLYLEQGCIPIVVGMPPYDYWEAPARESRIPECRTDSGVFLLAETVGAKSLIYIKDEEGLFTTDPKKRKGVKFIQKITVDELIRLDLDDLIIERKVLEFMHKSTQINRIRVINGLVPGNLTKAIKGEKVGTIIYKNV